MSNHAALSRNSRDRGQSLAQTLVGTLVLFGLFFGGSPILDGADAAPISLSLSGGDAAADGVLSRIAEDIQTTSTAERDQAGVPHLRIAPDSTTLSFEPLTGYGIGVDSRVELEWGEAVTYCVEDGSLLRTQGAKRTVLADGVVSFSATKLSSGRIDLELVTGSDTTQNTHRLTARAQH